MNNLITTLARGCYSTAGPLGRDGWPTECNLVPQLFAAAIVEECIRELSEAYDMTQEEGNHLREHFGISQ